MPKKKFLKTMMFLSFIPIITFAENFDTSTWLPNSGRVSVGATAAKDVAFLGADSMTPIYGNNSKFVFADVMTNYASDTTYLLSPGVGYRQVIPGNQIVGLNFFSDYERTSLGENFWVMSPGIEWMSASWDAHANGYFPLQTQQQDGAVNWADNFGVYTYENPHDNQVDDARLTPYAVIGNGVDAEVGYSFDQGDHLRSRIFLGGYYYHPQDAYDVANIRGATTGFTQPISKNVTISLLNSYDNLNHYIFGINLTATFGGNSNEYSSNVQDRIFDTVERHVGIIDTGAGTYDQQNYEVTDYGREYYPVEFVDPYGTGPGTAEAPAPLTQESLDAFNAQFPDGAMIFVQGNSTYYVNSDTATNSDGDYLGLYVYDGQDFYGRTTNYCAPATGDDRPIIATDAEHGYNGFIMQGGENTFSNLIITESSTSMSGDLDSVDPTAISGIVAVNSSDEEDHSEYDFDLTINNTTITGMDNYGVYAANQGDKHLNITTNNSQFNDNGVVDVEGATIEGAAGIYARNDGSGYVTIDTQNSQFNGNGIARADNSSVTSYIAGIFVRATSGNISMSLNNSTFNGNGIASGANSSISDYASGVYARNNGDGTLTLYANHSEFNDNGFGATNGDGSHSGRDGMNVENNSDDGTVKVSALYSTFNDNGRSGLYVSNLSNTSEGTLAVTSLYRSRFNHNNEYGIYGYADNPGITAINIAGTIIYGNGDTRIGEYADTIDWVF